MDAGAAVRQAGGGGRSRALLTAAVVTGAAVIGVGVGVGSHFLFAAHRSPSVAGGSSARLDGEATWAPGVRAAPPILALRDQGGRHLSLASLHGRPVAIEFFDSHCHQECPLAGRTLADAERALPRAQRPVLVVVSVNPLDTPASTRAAIRTWGLNIAPWHWLRGTHAQLAAVWKAYHIFVQPQKGDISHTEALYLIDRLGYERSGYLFPYVPARVAHDMRMLAGTRGIGASGSV